MFRIPNKEDLNTARFYDFFYQNRIKGRIVFYEAIGEYLKPDTSILDIGCGTGYGLDYLKTKFFSCSYTGVDISPVAITKAKELYMDIDFKVFNVCNDLIEKHYDYILLLEVLEHLENPKQIIIKCLNSCNNLVITVPAGEHCKDEKTHIQSGFEINDFKEFAVLSWAYFRKNKNLKVLLTKC